MLKNTSLFSNYADSITAIKPADLTKDFYPKELLIDERNNLSTWYAPFDYVNQKAKIVIVGITPGYQQAANALLKARENLLAGGSHEQAIEKAKIYASFSGVMRDNLTEMLDYVGINRKLDITSTKELFGDRADLAHFTSVLRYPVMVNGNNYNGTPSMLRTPMLKAQVERWFGSECKALPNAIYVPLGPKVAEVLEWIAKRGIIDKDKILEGIPHPSGANAERIKYFLMKKDKGDLSSRTNGNVIDSGRSRVLSKVQMLTV